MRFTYKTIKPYVICFFILAVSFWSLKILAYSIPNTRIKEHVRASVEQIEKEGLYPSIYTDFYGGKYYYSGNLLDNYTDAIFLNSIYNSDNVGILKSAAGDYSYSTPSDQSTLESFVNSVKCDEVKIEELYPYTRQWMGMIVPLRVLLYFFTYPAIRMIFNVSFLFIAIIGFDKIKTTLNKASGYFYIFSLAAINGFMASATANLAGAFFVATGFVYVLTRFYPNKSTAPFILFLAGATTAFLDCYAIPLLSYCVLMPLAIAIAYKNNLIKNLLESLIFIIKSSLAWILGYLGLWMTKWAGSSLILRANIFKEALDEMAKVTSSMEVPWAQGFTKLQFIKNTVLLTFSQIFPINIFSETGQLKIILICVFILLALIVIYVVKNMKKKQIETWKIAPYVIVSFAPFCLYIATYKHSYVHFWFVYRLLIAPMLCVWFIFMTIMGSEPKMDKMDKAVINSSSYDKNQL